MMEERAGPSQGDAVELYADIDAYYSAHPAARQSGESDFGCWWKDRRGHNWRVTYVHETGHVYAIHLGPTFSGPLPIGGIVVSAGTPNGPVVILGQIDTCRDREWPAPTPADSVLQGWADICGEPESLEWIVRRLHAMAVRPVPRVEAVS